MTNDSKIEHTTQKSFDDEATRHDLPVLYSNELHGNAYPVNDSSMVHGFNESQPPRKPDLNSHHNLGTYFIPQDRGNTTGSPRHSRVPHNNQSYDQWKTRNNHLLRNQQPDMVSDLGRRLENSGSRIIHNEQMTADEEIVRHWGYDEETFPAGVISAYSSPYVPGSESRVEVFQPQCHPEPLPLGSNYGYRNSYRTDTPSHVSCQPVISSNYEYENSCRVETQPSVPCQPVMSSNYVNKNSYRTAPPPPPLCQPIMSSNYVNENSHRTEPVPAVTCKQVMSPNYVNKNSHRTEPPPPVSCNPIICPNYGCKNVNRKELPSQGCRTNYTYRDSCQPKEQPLRQCIGQGCNSPSVHRSPKHILKKIPVSHENFSDHKTLNQNCCCGSEHHNSPEKEGGKREPSVKKLYRIVWLQNEQLALLQRQIDRLTERLNERGTLEKSPDVPTATASVGVMTSFINVNWATSEQGRKTIEETLDEESSEEMSDDELRTEKPPTSRSANHREESFTLQGIEIPVVPEPALSPQSSLHLNMKEYKDNSDLSSEEDDETSESDEGGSLPPVGWTFYDSVVGQVNNMLTKSNDSATSFEDNEGAGLDVRNATFDQLRCLGISFIADNESQGQKRVTFDRAFYPKLATPNQQKSIHADSDTSMRINALAMKYLTGAQSSNSGKGDRMQGMAFCNMANGNNNLSFATLRYLERYQLTPAATTPSSQATPPKHNEPVNRRPKDFHYEEQPRVTKTKPKKKPQCSEKRTSHLQPSAAPSSKILDITAIKQQPKLLPKKVAK